MEGTMTKPVEQVILEVREDTRLLQDEVKQLRNDLARIVPNEDYEELGMYLRLLIEKEQRRKAFQQAVIDKATHALIAGAALWLCNAAWMYLKHELRK